MDFSVIIPVCNVENYLSVCLDTVIPAVTAQDEILLIQGNSSDRSRELSEAYQQQYPFIRNIEQSDRGLSNARNSGMIAAGGRYILFIDSDDFVNTEVLKKLLEEIREKKYPIADIVMTNYCRYFEAAQRIRLIQQIKRDGQQEMNALQQLTKGHQCFWNVWKNIYRTAFLRDNQLFFREKTYSEDIEFMVRVFSANPRLYMKNVSFYYYRMGREGSLMNVSTYERVSDTVNILTESVDCLMQIKMPWADALADGLRLEYIWNLVLLKEVPTEQREAAERLFDSYCCVLQPTGDVFVKILATWIRLVGTQRAAAFLTLMKRLKRKREQRDL